MTDIQKMQGTFSTPKSEGDMTVIAGKAPVVNMREYASEVIAYTKGMGHLACTPGGYAPCHNAEEVIEAANYDSERIWKIRRVRFLRSWRRIQCSME